MNRYLVPVCSALGAIGFAVTLWMIFNSTPTAVNYQKDDGHVFLSGSSLYFNHKIFYWHVPHALMLFAAVAVSGVASIMFLVKRDQKWDDRALATAEVAALFGAVTLATGSIWAKAAWDHWWIWEKRLTMSLLLWLTLIGYVLVRRFAGSSADRLASGMAVFAMITLPFIYFMVGADDSHPQAGPDGNVATLDPRMRPTFWLSMFTFVMWFIALAAMRISSVRQEREVRELRERGLDAGVLA
jgi:heme exporter protein C